MKELERAIFKAYTGCFGHDAEWVGPVEAVEKLATEIDQLRVWNTALEASDATLKEEVDRYYKALKEIHEKQGRVCVEYATCEHEACSNSQLSWEIADRALRMPEREAD